MHLTRLLLVLLLWTAAPGRACTIFVLTDENHTLFCNNEDWFNPSTRLWFVPRGADHLGCAYVGFDNGWAQGGCNEKGLAFDWVSGFEENYEPALGLKTVRGNPSERMLESCSTIEEAITFYQTHLEPDFRRSRIIIADRTGASVIIGARDGKIHFMRHSGSRGFGWARRQLDLELAKSPPSTVASASAILRACVQPGAGGTKYSNVFDLKSGGIVLFPDPRANESVTLNLATELAKGGHYYDMGRIREQLGTAPRPLLNAMKRFFLDEFQPVADTKPAVTARARQLIEHAAAGAMRETDYAPPFWQKAIGPAQKSIHADLKQLGSLVSLTLVENRAEPPLRSYRYIFEFTQARLLGRYEFDADDKVTLFQSEAVEFRAAPPSRSTNK
ncbi:hypothetical protein [Horticoccus sp. 23ND18S-11]|uniref:hypothetical protein n=1 Tax=Horticoccus sp. 23ND18S-11 TaxID=3391832 RepID=UPI0039C993E8